MANQVRVAGRSGWINRSQPPSLDSLQRYNPNLPNSVEGIWQPFYDFQTYAAAGQTELLFFQVPQGQSSKTRGDTNMTNAGMFPSPTAFFVTGIMVPFFPGNDPSVASISAQRALANWEDAIRVAEQSSYLEFSIGSKIYLTDAPLGKFPPNFTVGGVAAVTMAIMPTTAGLTAPVLPQTDVNFARAQGRYYEITPFLIPATQNFQVALRWPVAITVTVAGRIGVILDGFWFRNSQ